MATESSHLSDRAQGLYKTAASGQDMRAFLRVPSIRAGRTPAIIFENLGVLNLSPVGRSVEPVVLGFTDRDKPVSEKEKKSHE